MNPGRIVSCTILRMGVPPFDAVQGTAEGTPEGVEVSDCAGTVEEGLDQRRLEPAGGRVVADWLVDWHVARPRSMAAVLELVPESNMSWLGDEQDFLPEINIS